VTDKGVQISFDAAEGIRLRDEGIARAAAGAGEWKDRALEAVVLCALKWDRFSSDEVWEVLGNDVPVSDNRAFGAVMLKARKQGYIEPTGQFRASDRPQVHRNPIRIWKSMVKL
jgi:hypothetical protein